jgi:hypothetical protein
MSQSSKLHAKKRSATNSRLLARAAIPSCSPKPHYAPTIHKFIIMTSSIIPEESAAQDVEAPANTGDNSRNNRKLSTISKMYDIRGDGELDEAELAA